jgi:hypothetical protein
MTNQSRWIAALAAVPVLVCVAGCAITKVEATERGNLAKEVMQRDVDLHHRALDTHQYASKENTAGGSSVGGGGCGCN